MLSLLLVYCIVITYHSGRSDHLPGRCRSGGGREIGVLLFLVYCMLLYSSCYLVHCICTSLCFHCRSGEGCERGRSRRLAPLLPPFPSFFRIDFGTMMRRSLTTRCPRSSTDLLLLPPQGQKIAHQKSTPRKSSWIFGGISQRMFQWHVPTEFHFAAVLSKGLSLSQWIFTGIVQWIFRGIFRWNFTFVISGV